jgi:hypothetical protein
MSEHAEVWDRTGWMSAGVETCDGNSRKGDASGLCLALPQQRLLPRLSALSQWRAPFFHDTAHLQNLQVKMSDEL